ncbi:hypothetical protein GGR54DRAFT_324318 [Hypoxylon sp. NC1633]|nr:hypothetical protein GGR54DRAFT_324318 [Hypoxylon sp. NC1633]
MDRYLLQQLSLAEHNPSLCWSKLIPDIRLKIFDILAQNCDDNGTGYVGEGSEARDSSKSGLAAYASVSKEWQSFFEKRLYSRLVVTQSCLEGFETHIHRQKALVKHIFLRIDLPNYNCELCGGSFRKTKAPQHTIIEFAIGTLFRILSTWKLRERALEGLGLEIGFHSPQIALHHFGGELHMGSNLFDKDTSEEQSLLHPTLDAVNGQHHQNDLSRARMARLAVLYRAFDRVFLRQFPSVKVVNRLVMRRQTRFYLRPLNLQHMMQSLPQLEYVNYECWREYCTFKVGEAWEYNYDDNWRMALDEINRLPNKLKTLTLFEEFNEDLSTAFCSAYQSQPDFDIGKEYVRTPPRGFSEAVATRSLSLERLFASYIIDARPFFHAVEPNWEWKRLTSLSLTSRLLMGSTDTDLSEINNMLVEAAEAALKMPKLQTMELWHGLKRAACVFRFRKEMLYATVEWRGTWSLKWNSRVIRKWEEVAVLRTGLSLHIKANRYIEPAHIKSHADAIEKLGVDKQVIHPVSLEQIHRESKRYVCA